MKKLVTFMLGMSLVLGTVAVTFAEDPPKKEEKKKKKSKKKQTPPEEKK